MNNERTRLGGRDSRLSAFKITGPLVAQAGHMRSRLNSASMGDAGREGSRVLP